MPKKINKNKMDMKRSAIFLQIVIVLIGIGAFALLLWEPQIEGRNAHATNFEIYFKDPFLAYAYIASIPFFVALFQAFKALGYAGQNKVFSQEAVKALRTIKYCALLIVGFVVGAIFWIRIASFVSNDDPAGGIAVGLLIIFVSVVVTAAAALFEGILQNAMDIKSKNASTR